MSRHYGLKVPDPWQRKRRPYHRPNPQTEESGASTTDKNNNKDVSTVEEEIVENEDLPRMSELSLDDPIPPEDTNPLTDPQYEEIVLDDLRKEEGEGREEAYDAENNRQALDETISNLQSPQSTQQSQLQNRFIMDLLSTPKVDGMTFCLVMLDKCYYELQQRYVYYHYSGQSSDRLLIFPFLVDVMKNI